MGVTAMVARRVGERNIHEASIAAVQAVYTGIAVSLISGCAGLLFAGDILRLMGASEDILTEGIGYAQWMFGGNVTVMLLFLLNAIFRGAGDASLSMRTLWLANGLNILLDPLFIFGAGPIPAFGVEGAAIATTIGRSVAVAYQIYHLFRGKGQIKFHFGYVKIRWDIIAKLLRLSVGGTLQFIIASASWIVLMRIVSDFGNTALAGYTIAVRVIIFTILPAWGMANAAATLVGQNLGAAQPERAESSAWRAAGFNMLFLGALSVFFWLMAEPVIGVFTEDREVLASGVRCLRIVCLGYMFYACGMVIAQSFNGAGDTRTPTIINFFGFWMFQIPMAYVLAVTAGWGPSGVYAAIAIAESAVAIAGIILFRRGRWKQVTI
jgi:putative MATE family efflux protein